MFSNSNENKIKSQTVSIYLSLSLDHNNKPNYFFHRRGIKCVCVKKKFSNEKETERHKRTPILSCRFIYIDINIILVNREREKKNCQLSTAIIIIIDSFCSDCLWMMKNFLKWNFFFCIYREYPWWLFFAFYFVKRKIKI